MQGRKAFSLCLFLPSLPPCQPPSLSVSLSRSLSVSMCVGVCASRLSRLRCCSPPPQMSWEEEGKRMYLAKRKQEEFGPACKTNHRLCSSTALSLLLPCSLSCSLCLSRGLFLPFTHMHAHTLANTHVHSQTYTHSCRLDVFLLGWTREVLRLVISWGHRRS